jgi:hypothetical protein
MRSTRVRWVGGGAVVALALGAVLVVAASQAAPAAAPLGGPPPGDPALDHFLCYHVTQSSTQPKPTGVKVADEFTTNAAGPVLKAVTVTTPVKLCAPITKYHIVNGVLFVYPASHPTLHLTCYRITEKTPTPPVTVSTDNQFNAAGQKRILTTQRLSATSTQTVTSLCVPSHKSLSAGVPPQGEPLNMLDHFKCYKAAETEPSGTTVPGLPATVYGLDQFADPAAGIHQTTVLKPAEVCNPAEKTVTTASGTQTYPVRFPDHHLVCFSIRTTAAANRTVFVDNQFVSPAVGPQQLVLGTAYQLCAPSFKQVIAPPPG